MSPEARKAYAEYLIRKHAQDVEGLSVWEMYDEYANYESELTEADSQIVYDLIRTAKIEVTW